jgi:predicted DCC family thiol-disulfide oxidoreductase YuxK
MERRPAILFYDAQCHLCRDWKGWIESGPGLEGVFFANANDKGLARRQGVVDVEQLDRRMCFLSPDRQAFWGYDAAVELAARLPTVGPLVPVLRLWPLRAIGRRVYDWIARHR